MGKNRQQKRTDSPVGSSRQECRRIYAVMLVLRGLFGAKAALQIALRADADQRSAERWLAEPGKAAHGDPSAENFAALLCSDIGDQALAAAMGPDPAGWPCWYARFDRQLKLGALRKTLTLQQRALEALERESAA